MVLITKNNTISQEWKHGFFLLKLFLYYIHQSKKQHKIAKIRLWHINSEKKQEGNIVRYSGKKIVDEKNLKYHLQCNLQMSSALGTLNKRINIRKMFVGYRTCLKI